MEYLWHPHSGIATVTVVLQGSIHFAETTGRDGSLPAGGIEWMRAGNGVWHTGEAGTGRVRAFQLWVALPPELENGPFASQYLMPDEVPLVGPARVVLGSYGGEKSPIESPPMTYLSVTLEPGERWSYRPPQGHDVGWVALHQGALRSGPSEDLRRRDGHLRAVRAAHRLRGDREDGVRAGFSGRSTPTISFSARTRCTRPSRRCARGTKRSCASVASCGRTGPFVDEERTCEPWPPLTKSCPSCRRCPNARPTLDWS